eukprot:gene7051-4994_t
MYTYQKVLRTSSANRLVERAIEVHFLAPDWRALLPIHTFRELSSSYHEVGSSHCCCTRTSMNGGPMFRVTNVLRFIGAQKRYSAREAVDFVSEVDLKNEDIFSDGGLDGSIEWNLLGDPSGGLNDGESAEELSEHDLMEEIRSRQNSYQPEQFYLLFTPLIDIVSLMMDAQLLPENERRNSKAWRLQLQQQGAEDNGSEMALPVSTIGPRPKGSRAAPDVASRAVSHWFLDGESAIAKPTWTKEKMGQERYEKLVASLKAFYEPAEGVMPLTRVVRRHGLPEDLYVPFLRQISLDMYSGERRAATVKAVPGIVVTLANGRIAREALQLPEQDEERVLLVTALFMAVAHETGNTDLAYLAIQLLRAHGMTVPFTFQKQLTNVFSTASRIMTDWRVRSSGLLAECLPKWKEYLRRVRLEVRGNWTKEQRRALESMEDDESEDMSSMPRLEEAPAAVPHQPEAKRKITKKTSKTASKGVEEPEGVAQYFTSAESFGAGGSRTIRELEANIRAAAEARVLFWASQPQEVRKGRRSKAAMEEEAILAARGLGHNETDPSSSCPPDQGDDAEEAVEEVEEPTPSQPRRRGRPPKKKAASDVWTEVVGGDPYLLYLPPPPLPIRVRIRTQVLHYRRRCKVIFTYQRRKSEEKSHLSLSLSLYR